MTLVALANWFNFGGTGLVLALSLAVMLRHQRPYFARWVVAYAAGQAFMGIELAISYVGRLPWLDRLDVLACNICALAFVDFGLSVRGKTIPPAWLGTLAVASFAVYELLRAAGWPFLSAFLPSVVAIALSQLFCGVVFLAEGRRAAWQAWPQLVMGLWIFLYPALEHSPYIWVGPLGAGLLHVMVGMTMLLYLLEDVAQQLETRNRELVQAAAHKQAFLSIVSHELRTPLAAIVGFRELLEDEVRDQLTPPQQGYLAQMQASGSQLTALIDSMLDSFQLETGTLRIHSRPLELARTLEEALGPLQGLLASRQLALVVDVPAGLPLVEGDPQRIVQVVNNLVGNAAKFSHDQGQVAVSVRRDGGHVCVEVRDSGTGIPAAHLPHVFKPFYQGDASLTRRHGGSGLGLSIVRELVTRMGGSVGVESEPGRGSRFWFTLPVAGVASP